MRRPRTALSSLFVFYLLAFAVFFVYSLLTFPALLPVFRWPFIWTSSFVLFVDYCIPVTASALAVAYSLFLRQRPGRQEGRQPFHRLVSSQLALFITLSILYTILLLGFYPQARTTLEQLRALTREAREILGAAKTAKQAGNLSAAVQYYDRYLAIDRKNRGVLDLRDQAEGELLASGQGQGQEMSAAVEPVEHIKDLAQGREAHELIGMAQKYFDQGDFFSAHYYATLAAQLDQNRTDAVRLAARAWDKIASQDLTRMEKEKRELFEAKKRGYELFQQEDYLASYYHFLELRQSNPKDADVERYLGRSRQQIAKVSFFLDEAEKIDPLPGAQGLLFVNPQNDGSREIVSIAKMVSSSEGTFFKDIEVVRFTEKGLVHHFQAPYGKLNESEPPAAAAGPKARQHKTDVLLHGIERESRERESLPKYLFGSSRPRNKELAYLLPLAPRREELTVLRPPRSSPAESGFFEALSLLTLWQTRENIGRYGQIEALFSLEVLMRILLPFAFLNLCLLAVGIGWSYRFTSIDRPPFLAYLFIPVFPPAAVLIAGLYLRAHRIVLGFTLLRWGFRVALIGLVALQGVILAVMLILLAGQRTE